VTILTNERGNMEQGYQNRKQGRITFLSFILLSIFALVLTSCVDPKSEEEFSKTPTFANVTVGIDDGRQFLPSLAPDSDQPDLSTLQSDAATVLIVAVSSSTPFTNNYFSISNAYDQQLLNLGNSSVQLKLPLNTDLKLFEYTFNETHTRNQLLASPKFVISSSVIGPFNVNASTTSLNLSSSLTLAASPTTITITPASAGIAVSENQQFIATGIFSTGGNQNITNLINWTSSNPGIASVTNGLGSKGRVSGISIGSATITAEFDSTSDSVSVNVSASGSNTIPDASDNIIFIVQSTDHHFNVSDFNYFDADTDPISNLKIVSTVGTGILYLDIAPQNSIYDTSEDVTTDQIITATDINKLIFSPPTDATGDPLTSFSFQVSDGTEYSLTHVISIDVSDDTSNTAPTAASDTFTLEKNGEIAFSETDFKYLDSESDPFQELQLITIPASGTLFLDADVDATYDVGEEVITNQVISVANIPNLRYFPLAGQTGITYASFDFKVSDGSTYSTSAYTITFDVVEFCESINNGDILTAGNFTGINCGTLGSNIKVNHLMSWDGIGTYSGIISLEPGGTLNITYSGGNISGDIILNGGTLDIDGDTTIDSNITHTYSSRIEINGSSTVFYNGTDLLIGTHTLTLKGQGTFDNINPIILNDVDSHLDLGNNGSVRYVKVGSAGSNPTKGIYTIDKFEILNLWLEGSTELGTGSTGTITISETLKVLPGSNVNLTLPDTGILEIMNIELWGSLDIDSVSTTIYLTPDSILYVNDDVTFSSGTDLTFYGLIFNAGKTLTISDFNNITHIYFKGDKILNGGFIVVEDDESVTFSIPPLGTGDLSNVTDNSTGTVTNETDSNVNSLQKDFDLSDFCSRTNACSSMAEVIKGAKVGSYDWFFEADILNDNYIQQFKPDNTADVLAGGEVWGRIVTDQHEFPSGSTFKYLGRYEGVTVNSTYDGILIKAYEDISFVIWLESATYLYAAAYFRSAETYVAGHLLDDTDQLHVFFNHSMDTAVTTVGGATVPTPVWIDDHTLQIDMSGNVDGDTITLSSSLYKDANSLYLDQDFNFTLEFLVNASGYVQDTNSNPLNHVDIGSSLDDMKTMTDYSGNFTLSTMSADPLSEYFIIMDSYCGSQAMEVAGINPSGLNFTANCNWGGPTVTVNPAYYMGSGVTYPNNPGVTMHQGQDESITWNSGDFSGTLEIYLLMDDPSGLDSSSDANTLASSVNSKFWAKQFVNMTNDGSLTFDPSDFRNQGDYFYVLIIDSSGNWDISDSNFTINIVDSSKYQAGGMSLSIPNGGETWYYGISESVIWTPGSSAGSSINMYMLDDDSTGLDATDNVTLANNVNSKRWESRTDTKNLDNTGSFTVDPRKVGYNGPNARVLIRDSAGNWDITDNDFVINIVNPAYYFSTAVMSPNGGELWTTGDNETISWDTGYLYDGWVSIYSLSGDSSDLYNSNPNLADVVNAAEWHDRTGEEASNGSASRDPSDFSENGISSRLLIIDEAGNWDIVDSDFTIDDGSPGSSPTDVNSLTAGSIETNYCNYWSCDSIEQVIVNARPSEGYYLETQIDGNDYSVHFVPLDDNDAYLSGGYIFARQLDSNHKPLYGAPYKDIGTYIPVTVNSIYDGIIINGGNELSTVSWVDSGQLKSAIYTPESYDVYINGQFLDASDDLRLFFSQAMEIANSPTGITPSHSWLNPKIFEVDLLGQVEDYSVTLLQSEFYRPAPNTADILSGDYNYYLEHFVTVDGQVLDASSDPVTHGEIFNSLDHTRTNIQPDGSFSLAAITQDPLTDYIVFAEFGCERIGYLMTGVHPSGQVLNVGNQSCDNQPPSLTSGTPYVSGGMTSQASPETWVSSVSRTISWSGGSFSSSVDIYLLDDDPSGLDATDDVSLVTAVNNKSWTKIFANISNPGTTNFSIDPALITRKGSGLRLLIVDDANYWDITDAAFVIDLVDTSSYQVSTMLTPSSGGDIWYHNSSYSINWDQANFTGKVSLFLLDDMDSSGLDATDDATLTINVNGKNWRQIVRQISNIGSYSVDPVDTGISGSQIRILIIDEIGQWDISDYDFVINLVGAGGYQPGGVISPNGGENWSAGGYEDVIWDTGILNTGWVNIYRLYDTAINNGAGDFTAEINSKSWSHQRSEDSSIGSINVDPVEIKNQWDASSDVNSRILIIDGAGNWDVSDTDFTVNGGP
jgi:hypothetical protein